MINNRQCKTDLTIFFPHLFFCACRAQHSHTAETSFSPRSILIGHQVSDEIGFCLLLQMAGICQIELLSEKDCYSM